MKRRASYFLSVVLILRTNSTLLMKIRQHSQNQIPFMFLQMSSRFQKQLREVAELLRDT